jgi:predicted nucleic acid-binding protein
VSSTIKLEHLAEKLHMPLLTSDLRLARAYPKAEPLGLS